MLGRSADGLSGQDKCLVGNVCITICFVFGRSTLVQDKCRVRCMFMLGRSADGLSGQDKCLVCKCYHINNMFILTHHEMNSRV